MAKKDDDTSLAQPYRRKKGKTRIPVSRSRTRKSTKPKGPVKKYSTRAGPKRLSTKALPKPVKKARTQANAGITRRISTRATTTPKKRIRTKARKTRITPRVEVIADWELEQQLPNARLQKGSHFLKDYGREFAKEPIPVPPYLEEFFPVPPYPARVGRRTAGRRRYQARGAATTAYAVQK